MHIHRWSRWKNYMERRKAVLHQARECKKCGYIEDRIPVDGFGIMSVLYPKKPEKVNV